MSAVEPNLPWVDKASDWMNPILIKEARQSLKSRQFVATFMLMLIASWLISLFTGWGFESIEFNPVGGGFFIAYYVVLSVAMFIVVPFGAYRSLLNERDLNTDELLSITTLSPRGIVRGKLQSALLQLFIYYSAITPFMAFANLLKGINFATALFILFVSMFVSMIVAMFALMLSTFARQRHTQVVLSLVLLGGLLILFATSWSTVGSMILFEVSLDNAGMWLAVAVFASYYVLLFLLAFQISTAQLTFEADNRSTGIRLTSSGLFWLSAGWLAVLVGIHRYPGWWLSSMLSPGALSPQELTGIFTLLALWLAVVGLFAVTEDEYLSRRVRRELPRSFLLRLLKTPFLPGGGRGLLFIWLHLGALLLGGVYALSVSSTLTTSGSVTLEGTLNYHVAICCYLLIYLGFGSWLGRLLRNISGDIKAAHARVLIIFLFAAGCIWPHLLSLFVESLFIRMPLLYLSDPFSISNELLNGSRPTRNILIILGGAAVVAVLINLPNVSRAIREVLSHRPRPEK